MSIKISRDDFVSQFVNCKKAPEVLTTKLEKAPFCHLLSLYVIRPVACEESPFLIRHQNKQAVVVSQKKNAPRRPKAAEVTSFDDSDDDFEKVETDKKRIKNKVAATAPEVNPLYPASDPSKIIVVGPKKEKKEPAPTKQAETAKEPVQEEVLTRPAKAQAPAAKPSAKKAAPKTAAPVDNEYANAMKAMFEGKSVEPKKEAAPEKKPASAAPKEERPATANKGKKGQKKQQAPAQEEAAKPQPPAAPKKAAAPEQKKQQK